MRRFEANPPALSIVILTIFACSLTGCDQLTTLKEYFFPQAEKQQAAAPQQSPSAKQPAAQTGANIQIAPNVLVRVGNWTLTIEDFNDRLKSLREIIPEYDINDADSKKLILEELIRQQLLVMDAERTGLAKRPDIAEAIEEFRKSLLVREVATKITESVSEVTVLDAEQYYNENKQYMVEPALWRVSEIVANTKQGAQEILADILKGADFAQTARERSVAKTAAKGGDLGLISEVSFPEMGAELVSLEVGGISKVVKGPEGFYIFKLEEKQGGEEKKFSEVKDDIITGLTIRRQQERLVEYIDNLWEQANIYRNDKLLNSPVNTDEK